MTRRAPARALLAALALAALGGCAQAPRTLYQWESFPRLQYDTLLHEDSSPGAQIEAMQAMAEKAQGAHAALPPGFRAHLGLLQLAAGDDAAARAMFEAEKAAFPESAPYMDTLLRRLKAPAGHKAGA